jgi:catechol 2,3-dioxygenase
VEFRDPDNHSLEIYWGVDQVGSDGRVRPADQWHGVPSLEEAIAHPVPGQDTHIAK